MKIDNRENWKILMEKMVISGAYQESDKLDMEARNHRFQALTSCIMNFAAFAQAQIHLKQLKKFTMGCWSTGDGKYENYHVGIRHLSKG